MRLQELTRRLAEKEAQLAIAVLTAAEKDQENMQLRLQLARKYPKILRGWPNQFCATKPSCVLASVLQACCPSNRLLQGHILCSQPPERQGAAIVLTSEWSLCSEVQDRMKLSRSAIVHQLATLVPVSYQHTLGFGPGGSTSAENHKLDMVYWSNNLCVCY